MDGYGWFVDDISVYTCGSGGGDSTPPTVSSVKPPENGKAKRNTNITATFSEEVKPETLDPSASKLAKKTTYEVTIEGAGDSDNLAVNDLVGNDLAQDKVWTFKTGKK